MTVWEINAVGPWKNRAAALANQLDSRKILVWISLVWLNLVISLLPPLVFETLSTEICYTSVPRDGHPALHPYTSARGEQPCRRGSAAHDSSAPDADVTPGAFRNVVQSILGVLFLCSAFLRVQFKGVNPHLPLACSFVRGQCGVVSSHRQTPGPNPSPAAGHHGTAQAALRPHEHRWGFPGVWLLGGSASQPVH